MATAALAAVAVAALSASQAPGLSDTGSGRQRTDTPAADSDTDPGAAGDSPYYTDLPPLDDPTESPSAGDGAPNAGEAEAGIPATVLAAYKKAEAALAGSTACNLPWELLAAIGKVESGQARGGRVDASGTTLSPILGPVLNGNGFANISDTDDGAYDGDAAHDRAVGPMQFIPSTWERWGADGNGDGRRDPNNIYDAALAAGHYLCADDRDLWYISQLHDAILSYNHSQDYLNTVLKWREYYRKGAHVVPDGTGVLPTHRSDGSGGPNPGPSPSTPGRSEPGKRNPGTKKPADGGSTSPGPNHPGPGPGSPSPSPSPSGTETPGDVVGTVDPTAIVGDVLGGRVTVPPKTPSDTADPEDTVQLPIVGDTDTAFTGGEGLLP